MSVEMLESSACIEGASPRGVRPWRFLSILACALLVARPARAALGEEDPQGTALLAAQHPDALALLLAGERAATPAAALTAFERARALAPESPVPERLRCRALLALDRRRDAIDACNQAVFKGPLPINFRVAVAALLSGKPDTRELAAAEGFAERSRTLSPTGLWSAASACEVALRIGDGALTHDCIAELSQVTPSHFETRRALERAGASAAVWRIGVGWCVLFAACAVGVWQRVRHEPARG